MSTDHEITEAIIWVNSLKADAEIRAAAYEECAQIAERLNGWGYPTAPDLAHHIAKVIREQAVALTTRAAGQRHNEGGG